MQIIYRLQCKVYIYELVLIVKLKTIFVCKIFIKYGFFFIKMMITFTLYGLNPINILAMVYVMCFIIFQCITIIDSEKINKFFDFL